ncbi:hypothetical protein Tco_1249757, partial [Tanacetum coccineum]
TDKAKILRKRLKPGKHEHENGRARKKPGESYLIKSWGKSQLKDKKDNSGVKVHLGSNKRHSQALIGQYPSRYATMDDEKAQERWDFTLLTLTKKEQGISITDCHARNPCEISSDLTDENDLPMIGRLYGYDQEERVTEMRTRRFT